MEEGIESCGLEKGLGSEFLGSIVTKGLFVYKR